jgi:hypothetical protein
MSQFKVLACALGNGPRAFSVLGKTLLIVVCLPLIHKCKPNRAKTFFRNMPVAKHRSVFAAISPIQWRIVIDNWS